MRRFVCFFAVLLVGGGALAAAEEPLILFDLPGRTGLAGTPLAADREHAWMLLRDGQVADFPLQQATNYSLHSGGFRSFSQAELRGQLVREFGQGYEVSGVGHYLVVHPAGKRQEWAPRFEELYRSFVHYFSARGWRLTEPRFPLVAVVFPRQVDFAQQARREGVVASGSMLGYYSPATNRILMYDSAASGADWSQNAETIIHEAAHQAAFNTGVHSRFGVAPRWVAEGIGLLFEARGVWQSRSHPHQADRINRSRLLGWRDYARRSRPADAISQLVSSDRPFQADVDGAYNEAWALSFFLSETEPKKYFQYLAKTAAVQPFSVYRGPERLQDFTAVFGSDFKMLDARMQRFLQALK